MEVRDAAKYPVGRWPLPTKNDVDMDHLVSLGLSFKFLRVSVFSSVKRG